MMDDDFQNPAQGLARFDEALKPRLRAPLDPPVEAPVKASPEDALKAAQQLCHRLMERLAFQIKGRQDTIELLMVALIADGHVLLEDYPGSGKTTLAKALGEAIGDDRAQAERGLIQPFRRVQFTPDLLPSDVTGTTVFEPLSGQFSLRPGPVFAHVLLADEINRTSPKVQAALLEAMGEKQVSIDNETHALDAIFLVIATQNPLDLAGTYPLPEAQLDRFLFKLKMKHIDREAELEVLKTVGIRQKQAHLPPVVMQSEVLKARDAVVEQVTVSEAIDEALVDLANRIRQDPRVEQGLSTRALVLARSALKARAMLVGRNFVNADDLEALAGPLFLHRMSLSVDAGSAQEPLKAALLPVIEGLARRR